jgi:hypothetical protein
MLSPVEVAITARKVLNLRSIDQSPGQFLVKREEQAIIDTANELIALHDGAETTMRMHFLFRDREHRVHRVLATRVAVVEVKDEAGWHRTYAIDAITDGERRLKLAGL